MSQTGERVHNQYESVLPIEGETREEQKFIAFSNYLDILGRQQDRTVDLKRGKTKMSLPAYFRLPGFGDNPINEAALELLPRFSYSPGYADSTNTHIDRGGLRAAINLCRYDALSAARAGRGASFVVAQSLGLSNPVVHRSLPGSLLTRELIRDVAHDFSETCIGEVSDIAHMVQEKGYVDFLDHLVEVREVISERIDTIFSNPANQ